MHQPAYSLPPPLPEPSSLLSDTHTHTHTPHPSYLRAEDVRHTFLSLKALREGARSGQASYPLDPSDGLLPPLPPIPQPSTSTASARQRTPSPVRPTTRPPIPSTSYLSSSADRTPARLVEAFNAAQPSFSARVCDDGAAVRVEGQGLIAWIALCGDGEAEAGRDRQRVWEVRVHRSDPGDQEPPIHTPPAPGTYASLSEHLTSLNLSLLDLLYRLPSLPSLVTQACFYCSKKLRIPGGMPTQRTGWLVRSTSNGPGGGAGDNATSSEGEEERGRWVCWHSACEPSA